MKNNIAPQSNKERESFKRYNEFRTVKVNSDRIDFDLSCEHVEDLIKKHQNYYEGISSFGFNIFDFANSVGRNMQMPFMAASILKKNNILQTVDYHKFLQFFT